MGRNPTQPHVYPEDKSSFGNPTLWVQASSVPHRELLGLIQAGLRIPSGDAWQCPARVTAPDPFSPSTFYKFLCFYSSFQAESLVSKVVL